MCKIAQRQASKRQSEHDVSGVGRLEVATQKKSLYDSQRDTGRVKALREQFTLRLSDEQVKRFRFLDEFGVHVGMTRLYGRAEAGQRVVESTCGYSGAHYTAVATLSVDGVRAPYMFEGAMNGDVFDTYLDRVLIPDLKPGEVLVLDNLSAHKRPDLEDRLAQRGVRVIFLPPYSPDFNPIELCWSKVKTALRAAKARTFDALVAAIKEALESVSSCHAVHCFAHCGYVVC
jgi:transposase